jgi:hypothetical protein
MFERQRGNDPNGTPLAFRDLFQVLDDPISGFRPVKSTGFPTRRPDQYD